MHRLRKIIIPSLIAVMLMTGLGGAYGFVICDQGCLSEVHHENHHAGEKSSAPEPLPYYPLADDHNDSCHDQLIQLGDGYLEDEISIDCPLSDVFLSFSAQLRPEAESSFILANKINLAFSLRPQALVIHRSVVLII